MKAASVVVNDVCKIKPMERVLIITNPQIDVTEISRALYNVSVEVGATPSLIFQPEKTLLDFANNSVIAALKSEPDVIFSISANKLGKDRGALANPYQIGDKKFTSTFDYLLDGKKCSRAIWTPGVTSEIFCRSVMIDYAELSQRCKILSSILNDAVSVKVTSPAGTDLTLSVKGRKAYCDDGNFSERGLGGNIPSGEVYISPALESCQGKIVFDGSIALGTGTVLIKTPIEVQVNNGYVGKISGGEEADILYHTIDAAEKRAFEFELDEKLAEGEGEIYMRNARHIGELGIGLNPAAFICGNMLEDEKAFKTCHFAIGSNYDNDANALIHLDGVVKNPTITVFFQDGTSRIIEDNGELTIF